MSDDLNFFSNLLGGHGCSTDGTTSNNPIASFIDGVINSHLPENHQQGLLTAVRAQQNVEYEVQLSDSSRVSGAQIPGDVSSMDTLWSGVSLGTDLNQPQHPQYDPYMMQAMQQQHHMINLQHQMYAQGLMQQQSSAPTENATSSSSSLEPQQSRTGQEVSDASDQDDAAFRRHVDELRRGLHASDQENNGGVVTGDHGRTEEYEQSQLYAISDTRTYEFSTTIDSNRFRETPEGDAFQTGVELYERGDISAAIEAFEMELLRDRANDECWKYLGLCHAENDCDSRAIECFNHSIEYDPFNLDSLLLLGTAYTNELENEKALHCIRQWVTHNPEFHGITSNIQAELDYADSSDDPYGDGSVLDRTVQLMQAVSEQVGRSSSESVGRGTAEVNSLLGVLYNVSEDHDAAVGCFARAVVAAPGEYSLHNKVPVCVVYICLNSFVYSGMLFCSWVPPLLTAIAAARHWSTISALWRFDRCSHVVG